MSVRSANSVSVDEIGKNGILGLAVVVAAAKTAYGDNNNNNNNF